MTTVGGDTAALPLDAMAVALGVDLGALSAGQVTALAARCADCGFPELCAVWLMDEIAPTEAPDYCPNRAALGRLRAAA